MRQVLRIWMVIALAWSASASAQIRGQGWSVLTGRTVGTDLNVVHLQAGWPGISATLLHGSTPKLDLGGIFSFNYGYEGDVQYVWPGVKFQGLIRATLVDGGNYNLGVHFAPGLFFYFHDNYTTAGVPIPVGLAVGIPATSAVNISFNLDLPMFVAFGTFGEFVLPILFGGGIEYFLERNLAVTFDLRMGPMIHTGWGYGGFTHFGFQALMGLAIKL